jgi:hypothetical protein
LKINIDIRSDLVYFYAQMKTSSTLSPASGSSRALLGAGLHLRRGVILKQILEALEVLNNRTTYLMRRVKVLESKHDS